MHTRRMIQFTRNLLPLLLFLIIGVGVGEDAMARVAQIAPTTEPHPIYTPPTAHASHTFFIYRQCIFFSLLFITFYLLGRCALFLHWKVNYTRKAACFIVFFLSLALNDLMPNYLIENGRLYSVGFHGIACAAYFMEASQSAADVVLFDQ